MDLTLKTTGFEARLKPKGFVSSFWLVTSWFKTRGYFLQ